MQDLHCSRKPSKINPANVSTLVLAIQSKHTVTMDYYLPIEYV